NLADLPNFIKNLCIERVNIPQPITLNIFDPERVDSTEVNTGINPDITVFYDYTDLIIQNKRLFSNAIRYRWAINLMLQEVNTLRSNQDERRTKERAALLMAQIYGRNAESGQYVKGHDHVYGKVIEGLINEVNNLKEGYGTDDDSIITITEG
ncbi:MAG: hypothetical protein ACKO96_36745, partial [Flammeovirgaceae bacterium]